jgi:hypothetical protein
MPGARAAGPGAAAAGAVAGASAGETIVGNCTRWPIAELAAIAQAKATRPRGSRFDFTTNPLANSFRSRHETSRHPNSRASQ